MRKSKEELIRRAKSGDIEAFCELYYQYSPVVLAISNQYYIRDFDQEDWLQEGRIVFYRTLMDYEDNHGISLGVYYKINFTRYVYSLLRKETAKKRRIDRESLSLNQLIEEQSSSYFKSYQSDIDSLDYVLINEALNKTADYYSPKEVRILLSYLHGYNFYEISEMEKCEIRKCKKVVNSIKKDIKKYLNRKH